jgi:Ser/Thr protein kinase RdoA (MazF antagonist)
MPSRRLKAVEPAGLSAAHVRDVILGDLDRRTGTPGNWEIEGPIASGNWCRVFKAATPLAQWPLAVKVYDSAMRESAIADQAELLQHYRAHMASKEGLTVPTLWAALPEHRTLITEWIDEPRMDDLLRRAGRRRETRTELIAAAARWLRNFHDQSPVTSRPLKAEWLPRQVDRMLGGVHGAGSRIADAVFRSAYDVLVERAAELARRPLGFVKAHGDFVPHNLFHGSGRTVGFDLGSRLMAPVTRDIWTFLIDAEASRPFIASRSAIGPFGVERNDFAAFMNAYGALEPALNGHSFVYLQLLEVLRRWALLISLDRRGRMKLSRWVRVYRLRRMARHCLAALDDGAS